MTSQDDSHRDDAGGDGQAGPDLPADFEAVFRDIVANYGDRPNLAEPVQPTEPPVAPEPVIDASLFDTGHLEPARPPSRHEEEHFVPPEPPPVPRATPARRLAWLGLFVPPVLMLAAVVFGWTFADWVSMLLVAGFVGGFVFLVATMPRDRGADGDDGAVV